MWILTNNLKVSFLSAQGCGELNEDLNEQASMFQSNVTWKGKVSSSKTWCSRWNRVYWVKHLFSRTLSSSLQDFFAIKYTESLEEYLASLPQLPERERVIKTSDGFGGTQSQAKTQLSVQLDLFGASSKTSPVSSLSDTEKSDQIWNNLVTRLKKEYSVRKKLALRTREKDYSSLLWTTHTANDSNRNTKYKQGGTPLSMQVKQELNWATPQARDFKNPDLEESGNYQRKLKEGYTIDLNSQVMNWPTPVAHEVRLGFQDRSNGKKGTQESLTTIVYKQDGQRDPGNHNMSGKNLVLNPAWVLQLMGTTIEKTFFAWQETELWSRRQKKHG